MEELLFARDFEEWENHLTSKDGRRVVLVAA